jgi:hypothetical protein
MWPEQSQNRKEKLVALSVSYTKSRLVVSQNWRQDLQLHPQSPLALAIITYLEPELQ